MEAHIAEPEKLGVSRPKSTPIFYRGAVRPLKLMRHPRELMDRYCGHGKDLASGTAMFCGTLAVHGEIRPAEKYELELEDPVLRRKISSSYSVVPLPIEG
jgi:Protein of unknown function (DUF2848)